MQNKSIRNPYMSDPYSAHKEYERPLIDGLLRLAVDLQHKLLATRSVMADKGSEQAQLLEEAISYLRELIEKHKERTSWSDTISKKTFSTVKLAYLALCEKNITEHEISVVDNMLNQLPWRVKTPDFKSEFDKVVRTFSLCITITLPSGETSGETFYISIDDGVFYLNKDGLKMPCTTKAEAKRWLEELLIHRPFVLLPDKNKEKEEKDKADKAARLKLQAANQQSL
jgi:hypothetical protein